MTAVAGRESGRRGRFLLEGGLGVFDKLLEALRVANRHFRQHLAVQLDSGALQAVDETAVVEAVEAGARADAGDPQGAEVAFLELAADIGEFFGAVHRFLGVAVELALALIESLGLLQDAFTKFKNKI